MSQSSPPSSDTSSMLWSYKHFGEHNFWRGGFLARWYRFTAPPDAPAGASFAHRDRIRRGRIASAILLFLFVVMLAVAAIGWFGPNKQIFFTTLMIYVVLVGCVVLNRRGHVNAVGLLIGFAVNVGMYLSILRAPGGLGIDDKDILYLLVFADVFVGAILPAQWIWVPMLLNLVFSSYELTLAPHTPALELVLQTSRLTILTRVFQLHLFVSAVLWVLGTHARATIQRTNTAEETARLHHDLGLDMVAEQQQEEALREATEQLGQTLTQVIQGDMQARVPMQQGHAYWVVGRLLNSLLTRYQRAMQDAREVQILRLAVHQDRSLHQVAQRLTQEQVQLHQAITQALHEQHPFVLPESVTLLEPFLREFQGYVLTPIPAPTSRTMHVSLSQGGMLPLPAFPPPHPSPLVPASQPSIQPIKETPYDAFQS